MLRTVASLMMLLTLLNTAILFVHANDANRSDYVEGIVVLTPLSRDLSIVTARIGGCIALYKQVLALGLSNGTTIILTIWIRYGCERNDIVVRSIEKVPYFRNTYNVTVDVLREEPYEVPIMLRAKNIDVSYIENGSRYVVEIRIENVSLSVDTEDYVVYVLNESKVLRELAKRIPREIVLRFEIDKATAYAYLIDGVDKKLVGTLPLVPYPDPEAYFDRAIHRLRELLHEIFSNTRRLSNESAGELARVIASKVFAYPDANRSYLGMRMGVSILREPHTAIDVQIFVEPRSIEVERFFIDILRFDYNFDRYGKMLEKSFAEVLRGNASVIKNIVEDLLRVRRIRVELSLPLVHYLIPYTNLSILTLPLTRELSRMLWNASYIHVVMMFRCVHIVRKDFDPMDIAMQWLRARHCISVARQELEHVLSEVLSSNVVNENVTESIIGEVHACVSQCLIESIGRTRSMTGIMTWVEHGVAWYEYLYLSMFALGFLMLVFLAMIYFSG